MLVLTRKIAEKIYIGPDITITVLGTIGNRVRLGIEAPAECTVLRAELNETIGAVVGREASQRTAPTEVEAG